MTEKCYFNKPLFILPLFSLTVLICIVFTDSQAQQHFYNYYVCNLIYSKETVGRLKRSTSSQFLVLTNKSFFVSPHIFHWIVACLLFVIQNSVLTNFLCALLSNITPELNFFFSPCCAYYYKWDDSSPLIAVLQKFCQTRSFGLSYLHCAE
jgi:hypothetical protein